MINEYMSYYHLLDWSYQDTVHPAEKRQHPQTKNKRMPKQVRCNKPRVVVRKVI